MHKYDRRGDKGVQICVFKGRYGKRYINEQSRKEKVDNIAHEIERITLLGGKANGGDRSRKAEETAECDECVFIELTFRYAGNDAVFRRTHQFLDTVRAVDDSVYGDACKADRSK